MQRSRAILLLTLAACSARDADPDGPVVTIDTLPGGITNTTSSAPTEPGQWTLVHERDLQPVAGDPGELFSPEDLAIADDGTLYVVESDPPSIKVYSPDGEYLRSIGRDGAGPGEFSIGYIALRGDTLVLQDPQQTRATVFDAESDTVRSIRTTTCCYWAPIGIDGTGHAWLRSIEQADSSVAPAQVYVRFPIGGTGADTVAVPHPKASAEQPLWQVATTNARFSTWVPLTPSAIEAVDPTGGLVTGYGAEYRLRRTGDGRDTVALFGRSMPSDPVSEAEKTALVEARIAQQIERDRDLDETVLRKAFDGAMIPDTRPAFTALHVDRAGRTYVRRSSPDSAAVHLDLFDANGVWLDELTLASPNWAQNAYLPLSFGTDLLAIADEDADGLPIVRIYRLEQAER